MTLLGAEYGIEAIVSYGVTVAPIKLGQRAAFVHSLATGLTATEYEPEGKAAEEIQQLYKWMCKQLKM